MSELRNISENHPIREVFRAFTRRGLLQAKLDDRDLHRYLSDLLVQFVFVENLYRFRDEDDNRLEYLVDIFAQAADAQMPEKKERFRHLGDYSLFMLGMFPEYLSRPRRATSPAWYADTGRIGYQMAGELETDWRHTLLFRKLADKFEICVVSLHWVREYTSDPFYQFMFRQFELEG